MPPTDGGDLQASSPQIESQNIFVSLISGISPHASTDQAGLDLARDDSQRHAGNLPNPLGKSLAISTLADGARSEDSETGRALRAGEIKQATNGGGGGILRLARQRIPRLGILLQTDGFGQPAKFAAVLRIDHGDLDRIRPHVDDSDGGHV